MGIIEGMCWRCKKDIELDAPPARGDERPECGADLRSCKNCLRYSPGGYHDCSERAEDAPSDKERGNFCDFFSLKRHFGGGEAELGGREAARAAFDSLFS